MLSMGRRGLIILLALVAPWPPASAARAEEPVVSNLDLMGTLTTEVIEALLVDMPDVKHREILLVPYGNEEWYEFLTNGFTRVLSRRGYRTRTRGGIASRDSAGAEPGTGLVRLEYQALEFSLRYPKVYRSFLIGGRKVKRRASIRLLARLVEPADETVLWLGEVGRSREDQFAHRRLAQVEAGLFEFNKPPHQSTKWGKVVEPVVVSGIIVGLVYLFFSNQNNN